MRPYKNHFWFHKEAFGQRFFKEPSLPYLFIILRTFFRHKEPFVKQKVSSDVKGSLWNPFEKRVLLWQAPLFLRDWNFSSFVVCSKQTVSLCTLEIFSVSAGYIVAQVDGSHTSIHPKTHFHY